MFKVKLVAIFALLIMPLLSLANGVYSPGRVQVISMGAVTTINASYNVRYNPAVNNIGYLSVSEDSQSLTISGYDSTTNVGFSCYFAKTDALFATAEKALMAMGNGGWIYASRNTSGTKCTDIVFSQSSTQLD